jgi:hypothetical protein
LRICSTPFSICPFRTLHGFVLNCVPWFFMFCKKNIIYYVLHSLLHQSKIELGTSPITKKDVPTNNLLLSLKMDEFCIVFNVSYMVKIVKFYHKKPCFEHCQQLFWSWILFDEVVCNIFCKPPSNYMTKLLNFTFF